MSQTVPAHSDRAEPCYRVWLMLFGGNGSAILLGTVSNWEKSAAWKIQQFFVSIQQFFARKKEYQSFEKAITRSKAKHPLMRWRKLIIKSNLKCAKSLAGIHTNSIMQSTWSRMRTINWIMHTSQRCILRRVELPKGKVSETGLGLNWIFESTHGAPLKEQKCLNFATRR